MPILNVKDDQLLRLFAVDIVEEAGFAAIEAGNADEATAILETRSDIALVLTDINMPGSMDGLKLAHAVRYRWPGIKIIVVSGEVRPSENDLPLNSYFFRKPFLAATMISEIRSLIARELELLSQEPRFHTGRMSCFAHTLQMQHDRLTSAVPTLSTVGAYNFGM